MLMEMLGLTSIGLVGGFAFLLCFCEKREKTEAEEEAEEEITTCLMETIEVPQIEPKGYYNEYGLWIEEEE